MNIAYPMLFSVQNVDRRTGEIVKQTHCGVLEFVAQEGMAHMPHWMMQVGLTTKAKYTHNHKPAYPYFVLYFGADVMFCCCL